MKFFTSTLKPVLLLSALAAWNGCMTSSESDYASRGENAYVKEEAESMGQLWNIEAAAKTAADTAELVISRGYDTACRCWIRSSRFTGYGDFLRLREDTIILYNSGERMALFRPALTDSIVHIRHVTRSGNGREVDLYFKTTLTWDSAMKVAVWNGSFSGTLDGETFSGEIIRVFRHFAPGLGIGGRDGFGFPYRGAILVRWRGFENEMTYEGERRCKVVVKRRGRVVRRIEINEDQQEIKAE